MTLEEMEKNTAPAQQQAPAGGQAGRSLPEPESSYDSEIKALYGKIADRGDFKYELSLDPNYSAYKDSYMRQGRLAMQDSMGKAADLTGGYGSSYAQRAGQQQYEGYLEKLSAAIPELYQNAYERYLARGNALNAQLSAASGLAGMELERYNAALNRAQLEYQRQQDAYKNLAAVISSTGYVPSDQELEQSGMSREQAGALSYEFMRVNGLLPPEGGAGGGGINYYNLHPTSPFDIGYREGMFGGGSAGYGYTGAQTPAYSGGKSGAADSDPAVRIETDKKSR